MKIVSRPINIGRKVVNLFPPKFYPSINNFTWYFWGNAGTKNQVFSFQTYLRSKSTCKNKWCFMTLIIVLRPVEITRFSNYERISKLKNQFIGLPRLFDKHSTVKINKCFVCVLIGNAAWWDVFTSYYYCNAL